MNTHTADGHQISVMRAMLKRWGAICEVARNWNGYPSMDTTYRATFGRGGAKRLPIPNVPAFAVQLSSEVMRLPDDEGNAITLWYAHQFNTDGRWLALEDKALLLGVGVQKLRGLERSGRERLVIDASYVLDTWQVWLDERASLPMAVAS